ncbi:CapA family protein [Arthrobacter sp. JSM 101049]|uniref:CapA family protein n=1 Tax=Arthrobacter sp. JSM 101049 TaxID=929097 RepID=UPI003563DD4A
MTAARATPRILPRSRSRILPAVLAAGLLLTGCAPAAGPAATGPTATGPTGTAPGSTPPQATTPLPQAGSGTRGSRPATPRSVSVVVTGDVLLHPPLWAQARRDGSAADPDFGPLLSGLRPYLADADLAVCSLETPVGTPDGPFSGYPSFVVPPQILPALAETGYDACTTATNHAIDGGIAGLERTLDALDDAGLEHTGTYRSAAEAARPLVLDAGGVRVGIVTATYGLNGLTADTGWRVDIIDTDRMIAQAKAARTAGADVVLAGFHSGAEYSARPTAAQRRTAHTLADSGEFDVVYSHHTHSVLPVEKHDGVWIAYGLGNSVSAHATDLAVNREGVSLKLEFTRRDGRWRAAPPQWAAHIMAQDPVRWCALPAATPCTTQAVDAASLQRTRTRLEALGADDDGARPWHPDAP